MQCLIDADVLLHELGWSGQFKDKETGEEVLLPFENVVEMLDEKIRVIEHECYATEPSILFLSSSPTIAKMWNRGAEWYAREPVEHVANHRYAAAVTKPYKGTRNNPKPIHFYNIAAYMLGKYNCVISRDGLEADDEICIAQRTALDFGVETTICSRDKDLRICKGWHYSWECGKQAAVGPHHTDAYGSLHMKENKEVYGYGLKFFLFQMLTGDTADNIPGLPKIGKARAFSLLEPISNKQEAIQAVKGMYKEVLGEGSKEYFLEQASLLWMVQRRDEPFDIRKLK